MNENIENNSVDTEEQINSFLLSKFRLPVKYWLPTLVSVIIGTSALIWFIFSLINPIENDILRLQNSHTPRGHASISSTTILKNTNGLILSDKQEIALKNIEYRLNKREDLVLLIIGYCDDNLDKQQSDKINESQIYATNIYDRFKKAGIETERIFYKGYGHEVPSAFPKDSKQNVALIVVDLYYFMELAVRGDILSVI
nr:hypothetical protein [uncultured Draconibacterium sp.]